MRPHSGHMRLFDREFYSFVLNYIRLFQGDQVLRLLA